MPIPLPVTDEEWKEAIKQQSLDVTKRTDDDLRAILVMSEAKLPRIGKCLYWITKYPDFKRKELEEADSSLSAIDIDNEVVSDTTFYQNKYDRMEYVIALIKKEHEFRGIAVVVP